MLRYGYVNKYMHDRSYGFITETLTGKSRFFHRTEFLRDPKLLLQNLRVSFTVVEHEGRDKCIQVEPIAAPTVSDVLSAPEPDRGYRPGYLRPTPVPVMPGAEKVLGGSQQELPLTDGGVK